AKGVGKLVRAYGREGARCQHGLDVQGSSTAFGCAHADPRGKVSKARTKLLAGIASTCTFPDPDARTGGNERIDGLGACGDTLAQLDDCVVDLVAKRIGTGLLGTA